MLLVAHCWTCYVCLVQGSLVQEPALRYVLSSAGEKVPLLPLASKALPSAAQLSSARRQPPLLQGPVAGMCSCLLPIRPPRSACAKLLSDQLAPSMYWCMGFFFPRCRIFHEAPVSPFFQPVKLPLNFGIQGREGYYIDRTKGFLSLSQLYLAQETKNQYQEKRKV